MHGGVRGGQRRGAVRRLGGVRHGLAEQRFGARIGGARGPRDGERGEGASGERVADTKRILERREGHREGAPEQRHVGRGVRAGGPSGVDGAREHPRVAPLRRRHRNAAVAGGDGQPRDDARGARIRRRRGKELLEGRRRRQRGDGGPLQRRGPPITGGAKLHRGRVGVSQRGQELQRQRESTVRREAPAGVEAALQILDGGGDARSLGRGGRRIAGRRRSRSCWNANAHRDGRRRWGRGLTHAHHRDPRRAEQDHRSKSGELQSAAVHVFQHR